MSPEAGPLSQLVTQRTKGDEEEESCCAAMMGSRGRMTWMPLSFQPRFSPGSVRKGEEEEGNPPETHAGGWGASQATRAEKTRDGGGEKR